MSEISVGQKVYSRICKQFGVIERIDETGYLIRFSKNKFDYWFHYAGEFEVNK